jgi:hypothetical protein
VVVRKSLPFVEVTAGLFYRAVVHALDEMNELDITRDTLIIDTHPLKDGGKSDSKTVTVAMERLAEVLPHPETKEFPQLDHFGIERTAPRKAAKVVSDFLLK